MGRAADLLQLLDLWVARGWLRALDKAFVAFLHELDPECDPLVLMAAALSSHQLGHGHVCLDLFETLKEPDFALSLPPKGTRRMARRRCLPKSWPALRAHTGARSWPVADWSPWLRTTARVRDSGPWFCRASAYTCGAIGPMSDA